MKESYKKIFGFPKIALCKSLRGKPERAFSLFPFLWEKLSHWLEARFLTKFCIEPKKYIGFLLKQKPSKRSGFKGFLSSQQGLMRNDGFASHALSRGLVSLATCTPISNSTYSGTPRATWDTTSGGVRMAATTKMPSSTYLRLVESIL